MTGQEKQVKNVFKRYSPHSSLLVTILKLNKFIFGGSRRLHNLYSSPSIIKMIETRRMRWVRHVARMVAKRNAYRILLGKPEGKRLLRRPRCTWVNSIKMDLREIGWGGMTWIRMAQDRDQWRALVNTVMNLRVP
jgi:hypothetical protein